MVSLSLSLFVGPLRDETETAARREASVHNLSRSPITHAHATFAIFYSSSLIPPGKTQLHQRVNNFFGVGAAKNILSSLIFCTSKEIFMYKCIIHQLLALIHWLIQ